MEAKQSLQKGVVNHVDAAERLHEVKPAKMAQGISEVEVAGDLRKSCFAGVIGKGTR